MSRRAVVGMAVIAGVAERPEDLDDTEAVAEWIWLLEGGPVDTNDPAAGAVDDFDTPAAGPMTFVPLGEVFNAQRDVQAREFHDALGWSLLDVESFVEFSLVPQPRISVVSGSFDDDTRQRARRPG